MTADRHVPVKTITASRGKAGRAEPIASLYEQGKVCHVGRFAQLEEQMLNISSACYVSAKSPDRLDAMVWALSELMLGLAPRVVQAEAMIHVPAGDHLQHGGLPHDEVEPCDRKVGKEYQTEKPKGEGERRDDIFWGAF